MSRNRFRIGSIAVLFAVVVLCVAIFGVLTVSSAVSDRRAAERYGEHVEVCMPAKTPDKTGFPKQMRI
mgnify:FL=1